MTLPEIRVEEVYRCRSCGATIRVVAYVKGSDLWPDAQLDALRERGWHVEGRDQVGTALCPACST